MVPFPDPASPHVACGFPAGRAPAYFVSRVISGRASAFAGCTPSPNPHLLRISWFFDRIPSSSDQRTFPMSSLSSSPRMTPCRAPLLLRTSSAEIMRGCSVLDRRSLGQTNPMNLELQRMRFWGRTTNTQQRKTKIEVRNPFFIDCPFPLVVGRPTDHQRANDPTRVGKCSTRRPSLGEPSLFLGWAFTLPG